MGALTSASGAKDEDCGVLGAEPVLDPGCEGRHHGWTGGMFDGATHYHADDVLPNWASYKTLIVKINSHIFYRWEK